MDRRVTYNGQIPLEEDFTQPQRNAMVGLAKLSEALLGTDPIIDGLLVAPTAPASLAVQVQPGQIYASAVIDATPYGTVLLADTTHQVVKQGLLLDAQTIAINPPGTTGFQQYFLVQCAFQEREAGAVVLPYYNSANPGQALAGPNNSTEAQYTERRGTVVLQLKAGAPAPAGSAVRPFADPGWVGLAWVLLANGATSIQASNITPYVPVPRLRQKLPQLGRAAGASVKFVTSSVTLTADDAGVVVIDCAAFAGMIDIVLPPIATAAGTPLRFTFHGRSYSSAVVNGVARIFAATGDALDIVAAGAPLYVSTWTSVNLVSDGAGAWVVFGHSRGLRLQMMASVAQTIPSGIETAVTFHQPAIGSAIPQSGLRWVAASPTAILIDRQMGFTASAGVGFDVAPSSLGTRRCMLQMNGNQRGDGLAAHEQPPSQGYFTHMSLGGGASGSAPNSYIQLIVFQDSGAPLNLLPYYTWLNVEVFA